MCIYLSVIFRGHVYQIAVNDYPSGSVSHVGVDKHNKTWLATACREHGEAHFVCALHSTGVNE